MEQQGQFKNSNLWQAGSAVADSLAEFEGAMDRLVGRLEITGEQIEHLKDIKDRAENIINQVIGFSQRAVSDAKKNPTGYIAVAALIGLFVLSRSRRGIKNNVLGKLEANPETH